MNGLCSFNAASAKCVSNLIYCLSGAASKVKLIIYWFSIRFNLVYDVRRNSFRCTFSRFETRDVWLVSFSRLKMRISLTL